MNIMLPSRPGLCLNPVQLHIIPIQTNAYSTRGIRDSNLLLRRDYMGFQGKRSGRTIHVFRCKLDDQRNVTATTMRFHDNTTLMRRGHTQDRHVVIWPMTLRRAQQRLVAQLIAP